MFNGTPTDDKSTDEIGIFNSRGNLLLGADVRMIVKVTKTSFPPTPISLVRAEDPLLKNFTAEILVFYCRESGRFAERTHPSSPFYAYCCSVRDVLSTTDSLMWIKEGCKGDWTLVV